MLLGIPQSLISPSVVTETYKRNEQWLDVYTLHNSLGKNLLRSVKVM